MNSAPDPILNQIKATRPTEPRPFYDGIRDALQAANEMEIDRDGMAAKIASLEKQLAEAKRPVKFLTPQKLEDVLDRLENLAEHLPGFTESVLPTLLEEAYDTDAPQDAPGTEPAATDAESATEEGSRETEEPEGVFYPRKLAARHVVGAGWEIHGDFSAGTNCVEYSTKPGDHGILKSAEATVFAFEPWIQFAEKKWKAMISKVLPEMADAWNDRYAESATEDAAPEKEEPVRRCCETCRHAMIYEPACIEHTKCDRAHSEWEPKSDA